MVEDMLETEIEGGEIKGTEQGRDLGIRRN